MWIPFLYFYQIIYHIFVFYQNHELLISWSGNKEANVYCILGRKVAVDASMSIYQFLIAVRQEGNQLTSADGEVTRFVKSPAKWPFILNVSFKLESN